MISFFKKGRKLLGMNARNLEYIRPCNLKKAREIADNKILSKKILGKGEIPVPKLIAKISNLEELDKFDWNILPESFVLKPNRGFGGEGIIVVYGKRKPARNASKPDNILSDECDNSNETENHINNLCSNAGGNGENVWIKADGSNVTVEDLKSHIQNIIDGAFSLSNVSDIAFFEERLKLLKLFKPYTFKGIPDIRVIVYNKVPVMAMLRLPTKESQGKANLHQGAIGVGIDLASGTTTTAVSGKSKIIEYVPGTRMLLSGIKIPFWNDILKLAVKAQEITGLGYLGADVAIDKEQGPVFLELNARPGLSIQIANLDGLKRRLERVQDLKIKTIERGVRMGMDLFGGEVEEEVEDISGRKVIGTVEKVKFIGKDGKEIETEGKIDTGAYSTSIDAELAKQLGFEETLNGFSGIDLSSYKLVPENEGFIKKDILEKYKEKIPRMEDVAVVFSASGSSIRPVVEVNFVMDGVPIISKANIISRESLSYKIIIGKKDLKKFLIDVNK